MADSTMKINDLNQKCWIPHGFQYFPIVFRWFWLKPMMSSRFLSIAHQQSLIFISFEVLLIKSHRFSQGFQTLLITIVDFLKVLKYWSSKTAAFLKGFHYSSSINSVFLKGFNYCPSRTTYFLKYVILILKTHWCS